MERPSFLVLRSFLFREGKQLILWIGYDTLLLLLREAAFQQLYIYLYGFALFIFLE